MKFKRLVFLVTMRAGSHYLARLLSGDTYTIMSKKYERLDTTTIPSYPLWTPGMAVGTDRTQEGIYITYVADSVSTFLAPQRGAEWNAEELSNLPDVGVVHMIRDGRNQIASHKALELRPTNKTKNWNANRLNQGIKGFKYRVQNALAAQAAHPDRYLIVKFEDMVQNPLYTLGVIGRFAELEFDEDQIRCALQMRPNSSWDHTLSRETFMDNFQKKDVTERWKTLSKPERYTISKAMDKELIQLGYIKDNTWTEEE